MLWTHFTYRTLVFFVKTLVKWYTRCNDYCITRCLYWINPTQSSLLFEIHRNFGQVSFKDARSARTLYSDSVRKPQLAGPCVSCTGNCNWPSSCSLTCTGKGRWFCPFCSACSGLFPAPCLSLNNVNRTTMAKNWVTAIKTSSLFRVAWSCNKTIRPLSQCSVSGHFFFVSSEVVRGSKHNLKSGTGRKRSLTAPQSVQPNRLDRRRKNTRENICLYSSTPITRGSQRHTYRHA